MKGLVWIMFLTFVYFLALLIIGASDLPQTLKHVYSTTLTFFIVGFDAIICMLDK